MKEKQLKLFYNKYGEKEENNPGRHMLAIPIDTLILIGIIVLFIVIISFSLGIKQGKKIYLASTTTKLTQHEDKKTNTANKNLKRNIHENYNNMNKESSKHQEKNKDKNKEKEKEYIVQLASYLKENLANKEKEYLKNEGFSAEISKKGRYMMLYVGKFNTKEDAEKIKTSLKKRYSDCFIRRL